MAVKHLLHVDMGAVNHLAEFGNLANLLEGDDLALLVAIDTETGRVIATILKSGKTCNEQITMYQLMVQRLCSNMHHDPIV